MSTGSTRTLGYEYQSPHTTGVTWGVVPYWGADGAPANLPRSTNLSASWSAWPIVEKTSFARLEQQLGNGWSVKGNVSHAVRDTDGSVWYGAAGYPRADGTGVTAYLSHFNEHSTMDVFDVNVGGPFQLFGREHELVFGLGQSVRKGARLASLDRPGAGTAGDPLWSPVVTGRTAPARCLRCRPASPCRSVAGRGGRPLWQLGNPYLGLWL
ncbi:hypothetical protein G6F31_016362 [Rhizopus arrhizus]|nr:hypothetical protein G6F31_016362 [Rhizopus arrhizus]